MASKLYSMTPKEMKKFIAKVDKYRGIYLEIPESKKSGIYYVYHSLQQGRKTKVDVKHTAMNANPITRK